MYRKLAFSRTPVAQTTKKTAAQAIIEELAAENRRVVSDWRATIILRRATQTTPADQRRWSVAPADVADIYPVLRQMEARGEIKRLAGSPTCRVFEVTVPYARGGLVGEDEVLMELHPYSALSHLSALAFHALTDKLPREMTISIPSRDTGEMLPPGTDSQDWEGMALVRGQHPKRVLNRAIRWIRLPPDRVFGIEEYRPRGYPVRVTTPERTLLDCLQEPDLCGGFDNVLRAWLVARDNLDLDRLVGYAERFSVKVLRQRAGFLMEELDLRHPALDSWQTQAKRGGSSKLLGTAPYAPAFSERWSLSINTPITALHEATT